MDFKWKNFLHGAFAFTLMMSILSGMMIINGLFWGGAF